jgi:small-conductance mechanosensitive channel
LFAIPHYIVLVFLYIVLIIAVIIAWFAVLFTRLYPKGLFDYVVDAMRRSNRVWGYAFLLVTDKYPPFRFAP